MAFEKQLSFCIGSQPWRSLQQKAFQHPSLVATLVLLVARTWERRSSIPKCIQRRPPPIQCLAMRNSTQPLFALKFLSSVCPIHPSKMNNCKRFTRMIQRCSNIETIWLFCKEFWVTKLFSVSFLQFILQSYFTFNVIIISWFIIYFIFDLFTGTLFPSRCFLQHVCRSWQIMAYFPLSLATAEQTSSTIVIVISIIVNIIINIVIGFIFNSIIR